MKFDESFGSTCGGPTCRPIRTRAAASGSLRTSTGCSAWLRCTPIAHRAAWIVSPNARKCPSPAVETTRPPRSAKPASIRSRWGVRTSRTYAPSRSAASVPGIRRLRSTDPTRSVKTKVTSSGMADATGGRGLGGDASRCQTPRESIGANVGSIAEITRSATGCGHEQKKPAA